jgi:putative heme iron utilization protein
MDDEARALSLQLLRATAVASLATLGADGFPLATLTSVATDHDGAPFILTSRLSGHTRNLLADPRAGLLFTRTGKGDPLAHPRLSAMARMLPVEPGSAAHARLRTRFLARHPKAALYVDFPDFLFFRAELTAFSLNGGFGKAYEPKPADLLTELAGAEALIAAEAEILSHMNGDHGEAVALYAAAAGRPAGGKWRLTGLDPDGIDLAEGLDLLRVSFRRRIHTPDEAHALLVVMAKEARVSQQS